MIFKIQLQYIFKTHLIEIFIDPYIYNYYINKTIKNPNLLLFKTKKNVYIQLRQKLYLKYDKKNVFRQSIKTKSQIKRIIINNGIIVYLYYIHFIRIKIKFEIYSQKHFQI